MEKNKRPPKFFKNILSRKEVVKKAFNDWLMETSLHGMKYFVDSHILAKLIWVIEQ